MRAFARHGPPTRRRSCSADAAREPRGSAGEGGRRCDTPPFLCQPGEERGGCPRAGALPLPACGPSLQRLASGRLGEAILHLVFPMPGGLAASGPGVRAGVQPPAHVPRFCPSGWTPDELRNRQCWRHNGAGCAPSKSVELAPGEAGAGAARRSVGREEPQGRGAPGQRAGGAFWGGQGRDAEMGWRKAGAFQPAAGSRQTARTRPCRISGPAAWALFGWEPVSRGTRFLRISRAHRERTNDESPGGDGLMEAGPEDTRRRGAGCRGWWAGLQGKGRRAGWWQAGDKGGRLRACDGSGGRVQDKQAPEGWVR